MENNEKKGIFTRVYNWFKNLTVKGLLSAILVVFVIFIILMSVQYLPSVISRVSSSLSAALYSIFVPAEGATMTADKKIINSGEDFTITFKRGESETDSFFTISYPCDPDVNLLSVEDSGLKNIDCEKSYYVLNSADTIKVRAIVGNEDLVRLVVTGAIENNETLKTETVGVVRVTIKNTQANTVTNNTPVNTATTTNTNTSPVYVPPTTSNIPLYYNGKPDLAVRVLQIGLLNTGTNFINTQTQFSYNDTVGIKFEVRNDGDAATGVWNFSASLPSMSTPTYTSPTQVSLQPGQSIQFTLGFNNLTNQYSNLITINVDPSNRVLESNEGNNIFTSTIVNTGYNNNYYNNNNYNYNYNTNGCYVNGMFTYNCLGNNNYNYNSLSVSCYATPSNPDTGDRVTWHATVYGGNGNYDYDWSGTNNLDSSSQNPSKTYSSSGIKYATVTVDSGGYSASQTCSIDVDGNNNNNNDEVDLEVEILAVGRMSSSGSFIEDDTINDGDDAAVRFRVTNEGDDDSGRWDYIVNFTPSYSGDPYEGNNMSSLSPGQSTTVTVEFENANDSGNNRFTVEVDPDDDIGDDNRGNNDDTATIRIN